MFVRHSCTTRKIAVSSSCGRRSKSQGEVQVTRDDYGRHMPPHPRSAMMRLISLSVLEPGTAFPLRTMKKTQGSKKPVVSNRPPAGPQNPPMHGKLIWNEAHHEWFCPKCGCTSKNVNLEDALAELARIECRLPYVERTKLRE
jgi:rubredoxin